MDALRRMASTTPAEAFGWYNVGGLETGKRADVVVLDDDYTVQKVMRRGEWLDLEPADAGATG